MHGCEVLFIGFFLKPKNNHYKLEVSTILVSRGNLWAKKIEAPKGPYLLDNLAGQKRLFN